MNHLSPLYLDPDLFDDSRESYSSESSFSKSLSSADIDDIKITFRINVTAPNDAVRQIKFLGTTRMGDPWRFIIPCPISGTYAANTYEFNTGSGSETGFGIDVGGMKANGFVFDSPITFYLYSACRNAVKQSSAKPDFKTIIVRDPTGTTINSDSSIVAPSKYTLPNFNNNCNNVNKLIAIVKSSQMLILR